MPLRYKKAEQLLTGFTLVLSNSMSNFAASDSSPLIVLVKFRFDIWRLSRFPLSLAGTNTGVPPADWRAGLVCAAVLLADPLLRELLCCLGLVERLKAPPLPTFRATFLFGVLKFLVCADVLVDFFAAAVSFFFVVKRTSPLVVFVMVIAPPFVVLTSSYKASSMTMK